MWKSGDRLAMWGLGREEKNAHIGRDLWVVCSPISHSQNAGGQYVWIWQAVLGVSQDVMLVGVLVCMVGLRRLCPAGIGSSQGGRGCVTGDRHSACLNLFPPGRRDSGQARVRGLFFPQRCFLPGSSSLLGARVTGSLTASVH